MVGDTKYAALELTMWALKSDEIESIKTGIRENQRLVVRGTNLKKWWYGYLFHAALIVAITSIVIARNVNYPVFSESELLITAGIFVIGYIYFIVLFYQRWDIGEHLRRCFSSFSNERIDFTPLDNARSIAYQWQKLTNSQELKYLKWIGNLFTFIFLLVAIHTINSVNKYYDSYLIENYGSRNLDSYEYSVIVFLAFGVLTLAPSLAKIFLINEGLNILDILNKEVLSKLNDTSTQNGFEIMISNFEID